MKALVTGNKIVKTFGNGSEKQRVLDSVSVQMEQNEFVAVMGPSGSGKSTLLFVLSGMEKVDDGMVFFQGQNLAELSEDALAEVRRTTMGFVFQQPTLLKNLNILDNILLPALRDNHKQVPQLIKKAEQLMAKTGIQELKERSISEVSGGQLQRAGICRALMLSPQIIFCDEPTGALNSKVAEGIMKLFSQIHDEGTAILLVTHDAKVAAYAQRVLFMKDGRIVEELCLSQIEGGEAEKLGRITKQMEVLGI